MIVYTKGVHASARAVPDHYFPDWPDIQELPMLSTGLEQMN
jgi:hypothetical protein